MTLETLEVLYNCFIVGGFVVPVLDVTVGVLGGALGAHVDLDADVDLDVDAGLDANLDLDADLDLDVDADLNADAGLDADAGGDLAADGGHAAGGHMKVPVNLMTLSLGAVVFGALGRLLLYKINVWLGLYLAFQSGVLAAFLLGRYVILPLRRNRAYASGIRHMVGARGRVTLEARADFTGTVEVLSATGTQVTYSARPAEGIPVVRAGETVSVVEVDEERMLCVVRPLEDKNNNG